MSGFFKTNIYMYIYICMFYFVAGDGTENKKICITCGDKQWFFTLDKTYEFWNKFYGLLETEKSFEKNAILDDDPFYAEIPIDINLSEDVPSDRILLVAGDIVIYYFNDELCLTIVGESHKDEFEVFKVGELEKSSINDFKSFVEDKLKSGSKDASFTFSIKEPEENIIVTTIIWLLLLLPLLFLVYFIFK